MAVEARRGCGYRKVGGLYLTTGGIGTPCDRLPFPLVPCPTCAAGVKQTRGFQWIEQKHALVGAPACGRDLKAPCGLCPLCNPEVASHLKPEGRFGLMWVGEKFYKTPSDWSKEAGLMGVSKRVSTIPKGLVVGETLVLVAHPEGFTKTVFNRSADELHPTEKVKKLPGVFHAFVPQRVELIVTPSMKREKWVKQLVKKQGVLLVEVPENDPDHAPTVRESARKKSMRRASRKIKKSEEGSDTMLAPGD